MALTRSARRLFDDLPAYRRRTRPASLALAVVLLIGLAVVAPLAAGTLPDSLWVTGLYDGNDYDDLIACSGDSVSPTPLGDSVVAVLVIRCQPSSVDAEPLEGADPSVPTRGPPSHA
jgi:hypothetical protein